MKNNHIFPFLWMRGESEEIMRTEMAKIDECGIGAVCVEARPHDEFCKEGWWHDMDIIIDEAKKRDMKIWILDDKHFPTGYANGLIEEKYPERKKQYIAYSKAIVTGYPNRLLSLDIQRMLKPAIGFWEIEETLKHLGDSANNKLFTVTAVKTGEGSLLQEEIIDLTDTVKDGVAEFSLPEGVWSVYVIFKTTTRGGNDTYINLIDAVSAHTQIEGVYESHYEHYADEFGKTIAGFFSDEPQFGNLSEMCFNAKLGKKKMNLPWSDELAEMLKERYGENYLQYLPLLFQDSEESDLRDRIRYDYMDCVSRLYKKNFSDAIGDWCSEHGVEYIGHVVEDNGCHSRLGMGAVHYFRAMSGQHMAGIDEIGDSIVFGAPVCNRQGIGELGGDGEFHHYTLSKLGASCGHLDPKKKGRTMCELFGAYGWDFGVRDMKYVLDHLLVKGINELVPHAFSMADYPDPDCPPHFYAKGNNPQFPFFAKLMKYANRMCELLSHGQHVANAAVLYDAEADWLGDAMPMQKVNRQLLENQIDLDIVPMDWLEDLASYNGKIENNKLCINGVTFDTLVIPYTRTIPKHFVEWIVNAKDFPVVFSDAYPETVVDGYAADLEKLKAASEVCALSEIADMMKKKGFNDISVDQKFNELSFYHYKKDGDIFAFQNESASQTFKGTVTLLVDAELVVYDAMLDQYESIAQVQADGQTKITLELAPAESIVLMTKKDQTCENTHQSFTEAVAGLQQMDISDDWDVTKVRSIEYPKFPAAEHKEKLEPVSKEFPNFAGIIRYTKTVTIDQVPDKVIFQAENVFEVMKVYVNGEEVGFRLLPPYQVDISGKLKIGENEIAVEVATTPSREQMDLPHPPFDFSYFATEATGMFGKIKLYTK